MPHIDKLIAKALSTDSEDEAISCLRMARKQGKSLNQDPSGELSMYAGKSAKHWYDSAVILSKEYTSIKAKYKKLVDVQDKIVKDLEDTIIKLYAAVPLAIAITALITYFLIPKTVAASCWFF